MTNKQTQRVGERSVGIQADRDVVINHGASTTDMIKIYDVLAQKVQRLTESANRKIDNRLDELKEKLISHIDSHEDSILENFSDPDFQFTLHEAQKAYARTGDDGLHNLLVQIIGSRLKQSDRSRITLILNDAITKASLLTRDEYSLLSFILYIKYTSHYGYNDLHSLLEKITKTVAPIIDDVPVDTAPYEYLESTGCYVHHGIIGSKNLIDLWSELYPQYITLGCEYDAILNLFPEESRNLASSLIIESPLDTSRFVLKSGDEATLDKLGEKMGAKGKLSKSYRNICENNKSSKDSLIKGVSEKFPSIEKIFQKYDGTLAPQARLKLVGVALGHAYLSTVGGFDPGLSTWIK